MLTLHLLPLLLAANIYQLVVARAERGFGDEDGDERGIFVLAGCGLPVWLLAGLGGALALWGWFQDEITCRGRRNCAAFPFTVWYDDVLLSGIGPARLMVPLSWLAFVARRWCKSSLPLMVIPLATLGVVDLAAKSEIATTVHCLLQQSHVGVVPIWWKFCPIAAQPDRRALKR